MYQNCLKHLFDGTRVINFYNRYFVVAVSHCYNFLLSRAGV